MSSVPAGESFALAVRPQTARRGRRATCALRTVRRYGPMVAACLLLAWGVSLGWWLLLPGPRTLELAIPAGAADAVAAGRRDAALPDRLELRRGDILTIRNGDTAVHRLGSTVVPPGHTVQVVVTPALLGAAGLRCSFHPSGSIGIAPLARPGIWHTAIPTLLAGVPLALALVFTVAVSSRLGGGREGES